MLKLNRRKGGSFMDFFWQHGEWIIIAVLALINIPYFIFTRDRPWKINNSVHKDYWDNYY